MPSAAEMRTAPRDWHGRLLPGACKKQWVAKACPRCGVAFEVKPSHAERRKFCSISCAKTGQPSPWKGRSPSAETRAKIAAGQIGRGGPTHWNWKGGRARTERNRDMQMAAYRHWRKAVFERDDYTCRDCGVRGGGELNAHHVKAWATHPELRYEIDNGLTLCVACHGAITFGRRAEV